MLSHSKQLFYQKKALFNTVFYSFGQIKPFKLPDLGEKIKDATIKKWYVKEGDRVQELDTLADVATDKLFTQIPSSYNGKIHKRYFQEEEACEVGQVLLDIEVDEESSETSTAPTSSHQQTSTTTTTTEQQITSATSSGKLATPAVRGLIKENKLNINDIKGTGPEGRITKEDVLNHMGKGVQPPLESFRKEAAKPAEQNIPTQKETTQRQAPVTRAVTSIDAPTSKQTKKMNDFQKGMQKTMTSATEIPHFSFKDEFDITELTNLRNNLKKSGVKLTFMPFFIKSFSLALLDFPMMNSTYDSSKPFEYTVWDNHNITIAIDTPNGLAVPNVKNCQAKTIYEIQADLERLRKDAEAGRISPKDIFDGTISISNIGNIGGTYLSPVILQPQVAIVALGKTLLVRPQSA
eukprot:CAMPEP_0176412686 /NCGR_PEP_ID=MMETSP0127-20121128/4280_1 /TAXON_ID=938130 /ORGANISM="Platyophrya macrostoma, Strain WH" /LENGTH=406 /DNA_ID=CAMNT_0017792381 /DNA_START=22 /DNA_END=1242 /DNA_ORIENTATION=-